MYFYGGSPQLAASFISNRIVYFGDPTIGKNLWTRCASQVFPNDQTPLRVTPAMAANVTKRLWEMSDIVDVFEAYEAKAAN